MARYDTLMWHSRIHNHRKTISNRHTRTPIIHCLRCNIMNHDPWLRHIIHHVTNTDLQLFTCGTPMCQPCVTNAYTLCNTHKKLLYSCVSDHVTCVLVFVTVIVHVLARCFNYSYFVLAFVSVAANNDI